jgi:predicted Zn-dependent protease
MPAVYKITSFQLPRGEYQQANRLANGITNPEVRSIMNGVIKAHSGNGNETVEAGKLPEAMAQLWKLGQDIKRQPDQARIDAPLNNLWIRLPYILAVEWKYLAQRFPDDVSLRYNAGLWMLDAQRYHDAVSYLRSATESPLLPNHLRGKAYASLGIALLEAGQSVEAEAPLRASLEQSPHEPGAYCTLAKIYKQSGRPVEATRAESACRSDRPY